MANETIYDLILEFKSKIKVLYPNFSSHLITNQNGFELKVFYNNQGEVTDYEESN